MNQFHFRHRINKRPSRKEAGDVSFYIPYDWILSRHEIAMSMLLVSNRQLFGEVYSGLQPEYFRSMPSDSGVYVALCVPTKLVAEDVSKPGDIDLLVLPYEKGELVLHRTLAIEIKVVRASFLQPGKSPNEFGFKQASGLQKAGFPYVAVAHLIVSDRSPVDAWREMGLARVLDKTGRAEMLEPINVDWLPVDLMQRSFGRLNKLAHGSAVGVAAAYIETPDNEPVVGPGYWYPETKEAMLNDTVSRPTLDRVAALFDARYNLFFDSPRW